MFRTGLSLETVWPGGRVDAPQTDAAELAELAELARALPPVAAWFGVNLATLAADLRFAWGQNSAVHGEFMGFRELGPVFAA